MKDPNCFICTPALCVHGEQADGELLEIDRRVAAAVKAEREACAKLAEAEAGMEHADWTNQNAAKGRHFAATRIEAAIRSRGSK